MKREDKITRDKLLVNNYILQKSMGKTNIVKGLAKAFSLTPTYIYKLIKRSRDESPRLWEDKNLEASPFKGDRLIVSNAMTPAIIPSSWWKRFLNKIFG